jgi:uncharacterized membrane protein
MNMSISEIKKQALRSLKGKWGLGVQLTLIVFLITAILPIIIEVFLSGGFSNWLNQVETPLAVGIFNILFSFCLIPLTIGAYWFYLGIARLENPEITQVFTIYKDGKTSLKIVGATILIAIFTFLWALLLIIPGIIKSLSYSQTFFLLKDHPEYSAFDAISESKKRMKGYKWKFFLMNLSFIGWGILCLFTLGIGLLWLSPYISTTMATFYNELIYIQDDNIVDEKAPLI